MSESMRLIRELNGLQKGVGTVLDIGANNGVTSIGMLRTGELSAAIAIEPEPKNFSLLTRNVKQNHLEHAITCLNLAASDSKDQLLFELSKINFGDHRVRRSSPGVQPKELDDESNRQVINVEADTLDNLLVGLDERVVRDLVVVWIDVQGYEGYVFKGARDVLSRGIPVVSEICPYMISRAGMSEETFCQIVGEIWTTYWVKRKGRYAKYPIEMFYTYLEELGSEGEFDNVIFTSENQEKNGSS